MISSTPLRPDPAASLMTAVIASSDAPLVLLNGALVVVAASRSFSRQFQLEPDDVEGEELSTLGHGEWAIPQLGALLKAAVSGFAAIRGYEMDLTRGRETRRLIINAERLDYADTGNVRVLLSVTDVTDARLAEEVRDNLVHDKEVLQRELQHRIANSLQVIASVLMQGAMRVQSEEARDHLRNAHHRVLSIATMQRQLSSSGLDRDRVQLRAYFTDLCRSIGAAMIQNPAHLYLEVTTDDTETDADTSVSLGLIVTELVINAIKHAFPGDRGGKIGVDYHSYGPNWKLTVEDDGVGMPVNVAHVKAGLGTSIVEALARQLEADIEVIPRHPGTAVGIKHKLIAAVPDVVRGV